MPNILSPSIYANFSMSFNFMSFLSKYLPLDVTQVIIFRKQQCVEPRSEEMQVPVKRFLYSFHIHFKLYVLINSCVTEKKQVLPIIAIYLIMTLTQACNSIHVNTYKIWC